MSWTFLQVVVDLAFGLGLVAMWTRLKRPPQDDPRLSRGLQLLQTKITVLEDLSDRTEAQVKQLSGLLDHKTRVIQNKILEAENQMVKIDHSMHKSMEVAEIFQDKIPHQEILERQRTVEYVKAARMAHSGISIDEILQTVHLPREQVELIAKFNREQLMFDETQLPEWATRPPEEGADPSFALNQMDFVGGLEAKPNDLQSRAKIESDFKHAVQSAAPPPPEPPNPAITAIRDRAQTLKDRLMSTAEDILRTPIQPQRSATRAEPPPLTLSRAGEPPVIRKVIFPRVEK